MNLNFNTKYLLLFIQKQDLMRNFILSVSYVLILINFIFYPNMHIACQGVSNQTETQIEQIYGIRWYLGDYFAFHMPHAQPSNQEMFLLYFNSVQELDDQIYLKINGTRYGCYQRFLEITSVGQHHAQHNKNASQAGSNFTNAMYKCIVYAQNFNGQAQISYQIISAWTDFLGEDNAAALKDYKQDILFQGKLRIPQNIPNLSFLFLADWGKISPKVQQQKGYKQTLPSILKKVTDFPNIGLLLFGGDLAYDYEAKSYIQMLTYIQPLTSRIPFLMTPGNHQSIYHDDSFQLFVQSNYNPMWTRYFNYFSLVKFQEQKIVFLSYDPQQDIFPNVNRLGKNLTEIFEYQLPNNITSYIKQNYDVIAFSHYPIFCSSQKDHLNTCTQNKNRFKKYRTKFQQMGLDLYLAGHLHIYQRTKQLCDENNYTQKSNNQYNKSCPIYVTDGTAGNNYYVAMEKTYDPKNFSSTIGLGTGYSIVTLQNRNISFQHLKIIEGEDSQVVDSFKIYQSNQKKNSKQQQNEQMFHNMASRGILIIQIVALVVIGGLAAYLICKMRNKNKKPPVPLNSHVQMVEQIADSNGNKRTQNSQPQNQ